MAATNRPESVDLALRRPGRFDKEFEVAAPSPSARRSMLHCLLARMSHNISTDDLQEVADSLHGFVAADIAAVCQEAALIVLRRLVGQHPANYGPSPPSALQVDVGALKEAAAVIRPSGLREVAVEINKVLSFAADTVAALNIEP
jgi:SpoVK/Ycf46/Vps4 family AAA+-type ATPase